MLLAGALDLSIKRKLGPGDLRDTGRVSKGEQCAVPGVTGKVLSFQNKGWRRMNKTGNLGGDPALVQG